MAAVVVVDVVAAVVVTRTILCRSSRQDEHQSLCTGACYDRSSIFQPKIVLSGWVSRHRSHPTSIGCFYNRYRFRYIPQAMGVLVGLSVQFVSWSQFVVEI